MKKQNSSVSFPGFDMLPRVEIVNVRSTHSATYDGLSRHELLAWVNSSLKAEFAKVDDLCTGAAYCQLMHSLFPSYVPLRRVKFFTNIENDFFYNFKILQTTFQKLGVQKSIPIDRLCKGRFQDNIEFLQWFKKFYDANDKEDKIYDPVAARNDQPLGYGLKGVKRNFNKRPKVVISSHDRVAIKPDKTLLDGNQLELTLTRSQTHVHLKDEAISDNPIDAQKENIGDNVSNIDQGSDIFIKDEILSQGSLKDKQKNIEEEIIELRKKLALMDIELKEKCEKLQSAQNARERLYLKLKDIGFCIQEVEELGKTTIETHKITNILLRNPTKKTGEEKHDSTGQPINAVNS